MVAKYELDCVDCSFQTVVVGEFTTALEEIQAHQREQDADPAEHFVNVHRRD